LEISVQRAKRNLVPLTVQHRATRQHRRED
jgi:hypothetical protein